MKYYKKKQYTKGSYSSSNSFFIYPKFLFEAPEFKGLSIYAKNLYILMLDRIRLSDKNNWVDKDNQPYIYFTIRDIMNHLDIGKDKSIKVLSELDEKTGVGLIRRKRLGLGKPSVIYVMEVEELEKGVDNSSEIVGKTEFRKSTQENSRGLKNRIQEFCKTDSNNNKYNNTKMNNTESILSYRADADKTSDKRIREREDYKKIIRDNIDYDLLVKKHGSKEINAIVNIMLDNVCSNSKEIKICRDLKPQCIVKSRMLELDMSHIDYVLESLKETKTKIYKMRDYMLTALYNSPDTIEQYYTNLVNQSYGGYNSFQHNKTFT